MTWDSGICLSVHHRSVYEFFEHLRNPQHTAAQGGLRSLKNSQTQTNNIAQTQACLQPLQSWFLYFFSCSSQFTPANYPLQPKVLLGQSSSESSQNIQSHNTTTPLYPKNRTATLIITPVLPLSCVLTLESNLFKRWALKPQLFRMENHNAKAAIYYSSARSRYQALQIT